MPSTGYGTWEVVALFGAVHGLFLSAVLWSQPRGRRLANRLLAALLLLYSVQLLHIVLFWTGQLESVPWFWGVVWPFPYLYGPLLWLHVRAVFGQPPRLRPLLLLHAVPALAFAAFFWRFYLMPGVIKREMLAAARAAPAGGAAPLLLVVFGLQLAHFGAYLWFALRASVGEAERDRPRRLRWVRRLSAAFGASFACWFAYGLAVGLGLPYSRGVDAAATVVMSLSIYAFGYTALRDPEIFLGELASRGPGRYQGSPLGEPEVAAQRERLHAVMRERRPWRDARLRLDDLAALVGLPGYQLSQVINQGFGERFQDYVNRHRVEEARRLLADPARRSEPLLDLAFEAGFNNKTSFNEAFKKFTGTTPSAYRARAAEPVAG